MSSDDELVLHIMQMQGIKDKTICHTKIVGQGHRFHGFWEFNVTQARDILMKHQKRICFTHTPKNHLEIEIRSMDDPRKYAGVIDPAHIIHEPYSLQIIKDPVNSGTVCKTSYVWKSSVIDDKFLHKICSHPYVLKVTVETGRLNIYTIEDRNIEGGIVQTLKVTPTNAQWKSFKRKQPLSKNFSRALKRTSKGAGKKKRRKNPF